MVLGIIEGPQSVVLPKSWVLLLPGQLPLLLLVLSSKSALVLLLVLQQIIES